MLLDHPAPFANRWHARWIWHEAPRMGSASLTRPVAADPTERIALLRRCVDVAAVERRKPRPDDVEPMAAHATPMTLTMTRLRRWPSNSA